MSEIKERPILFSGEMVRAILEGRKTQTRRVVKIADPFGKGVSVDSPSESIGAVSENEWAYFDAMGGMSGPVKCPYGQPGDRLWVRETWSVHPAMDEWKPSDISPDNSVDYIAGPDRFSGFGKTRPSIFMPRWASRITLEIVSVRVERLQDIKSADAEAEGVERVGRCLWRDYAGISESSEFINPVASFATLWQSINGPDSWGANPWVWVVGFRRIQP